MSSNTANSTASSTQRTLCGENNTADKVSKRVKEIIDTMKNAGMPVEPELTTKLRNLLDEGDFDGAKDALDKAFEDGQLEFQLPNCIRSEFEELIPIDEKEPTCRFHPAVCSDPEKNSLIMFGGWTDFEKKTACSKIWQVDIGNRCQWAQLTNNDFSPSPTADGAVCLIRNKENKVSILTLGQGHMKNTSRIPKKDKSCLRSFDPKSKTWNTIWEKKCSEGPKQMCGLRMLEISNALYVFGGLSLEMKRSYGCLFIFDLDKKKWDDKSKSMSDESRKLLERSGHSIIHVSSKNGIIIFGGSREKSGAGLENNKEKLYDVCFYSIEENECTQVTTCPNYLRNDDYDLQAVFDSEREALFVVGNRFVLGVCITKNGKYSWHKVGIPHFPSSYFAIYGEKSRSILIIDDGGSGGSYCNIFELKLKWLSEKEIFEELLSLITEQKKRESLKSVLDEEYNEFKFQEKPYAGDKRADRKAIFDQIWPHIGKPGNSANMDDHVVEEMYMALEIVAKCTLNKS